VILPKSIPGFRAGIMLVIVTANRCVRWGMAAFWWGGGVTCGQCVEGFAGITGSLLPTYLCGTPTVWAAGTPALHDDTGPSGVTE